MVTTLPSPVLHATIDIDILTDLAKIEHVVSLIQVECRRIWCDEDKIRLNIPVALSEALSNAMLRGNRGRASSHVHVTAYVSEADGLLVVDITDEGPGFSLDCAPDPTLPENLYGEGGRGLFLMRHLTDSVSQPGANTVRLSITDRPRYPHCLP